MKILVLILLEGLISGSEPSVKAALNETLPQSFVSIALPFACGYLTNYNLGNYSIDEDTSFGHVKGTFNNTIIDKISMDFTNSQISFVDPSYVQLYVKSLLIYTSFDYDFSIGATKEKGHGTADLSNANMFFSVYPEIASNGALSIGVHQILPVIGSIKVHTQGGFIFNEIINSTIKNNLKKIDDTITESVTEAIKQLNVMLGALNYTIDFPQLNMRFDYHPLGNLAVSDHVLLGGLSGEITNLESGETYPLDSNDYPDFDKASHQTAQLFMSQYLPNAIVKCLSDGPTTNVTSLPSYFMLDLTTTGLSSLLPQLETTFGADKPVLLKLEGDPKGTNQASIKDALFGIFSIVVDIFVEVDGKWQQAITFDNAISGSVSGSLKDTLLNVKIGTLTIINISYTDSQIGDIDTDSFKTAFNAYLDSVAAKINTDFANYDVTFPEIKYIKITSDDALLGDGYGEIGVTIEPHLF